MRAYWCCYYSYLDYMKRLDDAERGQLFTALITYAKDGEVLSMSDKVGVAFDGIRTQIDRDSEEYETKCMRLAINGSIGGKQKVANATKCKQMVANGCKEKEKEKEKDKEIYTRIITHLNEKAHTSYKPTSAKTQTAIHARLAEGFKEDDFYSVIDKKCDEWAGTEFERFLRPETLFGTKFEDYLNQKIIRKGVRKLESWERGYDSVNFDDISLKL